MSDSHPIRDTDHTPWPEEFVRLYREKGCWRGLALHQILETSARRWPAKTALVSGSRRISYADLHERSMRLAMGFVRSSIGRGDKVVVQLPNGVEAIETFFALLRIGAVPLLSLLGHRSADLSHFVRHANAIAYVTIARKDDFDGRELGLRLLAQNDTSLQRVILVDSDSVESNEDDSDSALDRLSSYESLLEVTLPGTPGRRGALPSASDVALLQLSGGSTGTPKLIPRTHDDYFYSVRRSVEVCGFDSETVYLVALPWAHNFPMSSPGFLGCFLAGGTVVMAPAADPDCVFPLLKQERVNVVAAVPPLAQTWLEALRNRKEQFADLRLLQVGGAKLSQERATELVDEFGCELQQVFGMAEGLVCYTRRDAPRDQIVSTQGLPMSELDEVLVVDEHDRPVPRGTPGQLLTRGPYTIRGYFRADRHNRRTFTEDGFYRTGDLVVQDDEGHLTVVGRLKHQINRGGEKIAPAELERHLAVHPDVLAAAVVGAPDDVLGERIVAFVVQKEHGTLSRAKLLSHLRQRGVAIFKLPDRFEFVRTLPQTHVGKIDTKALLDPPAEHESAPQRLAREVAEVLQVAPESLDPETPLLDYGMDSLHLMTLVERFRQRGTPVAFVDLAENPTLRGFREVLSRARRSSEPN